MSDFGPYSTAKPLLGNAATWIADEEEQLRIGAYALYEMIYWTVPDTFKAIMRADNDRPIYIPSGRTIVNTINRYVAPRLDVQIDPIKADGTPADETSVLLAKQVWMDICKKGTVL